MALAIADWFNDWFDIDLELNQTRRVRSERKVSRNDHREHSTSYPPNGALEEEEEEEEETEWGGKVRLD